MSDIEKALAVFQGISNRDSALATKYMDPKRYVEHNPHARDGVEGVKRYVDQIATDSPELKVIRAYQDGSYVFTQAEGQVQGQGVFFDVFKFKDGLIVEHWAFSAEAGPPNKSGHTQADGPTEAKRDEDTAKNKSLVREYYQAVQINGRHDVIPRYVSGDYCVRHEPGVADGIGEFMRDLEVLTRDRTIDEIKLLLGQGDFVFLAAQGTHQGEPCVYIDLYRVEDDKIVEHWGFPEQVPPKEEWKTTTVCFESQIGGCSPERPAKVGDSVDQIAVDLELHAELPGRIGGYASDRSQCTKRDTARPRATEDG